MDSTMLKLEAAMWIEEYLLQCMETVGLDSLRQQLESGAPNMSENETQPAQTTFESSSEQTAVDCGRPARREARSQSNGGGGDIVDQKRVTAAYIDAAGRNEATHTHFGGPEKRSLTQNNSGVVNDTGQCADSGDSDSVREDCRVGFESTDDDDKCEEELNSCGSKHHKEIVNSCSNSVDGDDSDILKKLLSDSPTIGYNNSNSSSSGSTTNSEKKDVASSSECISDRDMTHVLSSTGGKDWSYSAPRGGYMPQDYYAGRKSDLIHSLNKDLLYLMRNTSALKGFVYQQQQPQQRHAANMCKTGADISGGGYHSAGLYTHHHHHASYLREAHHHHHQHQHQQHQQLQAQRAGLLREAHQGSPHHVGERAGARSPPLGLLHRRREHCHEGPHHVVVDMDSEEGSRSSEEGLDLTMSGPSKQTTTSGGHLGSHVGVITPPAAGAQQTHKVMRLSPAAAPHSPSDYFPSGGWYTPHTPPPPAPLPKPAPYHAVKQAASPPALYQQMPCSGGSPAKHHYQTGGFYHLGSAGSSPKARGYQTSLPPAEGRPANPRTEIHQFMARFASMRPDGIVSRKDISVKELRHIIPLLIMDVYGFKDEPAQKKVKGLWERAPASWPADVPYCDPNNGNRGEHGKPKKEILVRMFHYLLNKYQEQSCEPGKPQIRFCMSPQPPSTRAAPYGSLDAPGTRHDSSRGSYESSRCSDDASYHQYPSPQYPAPQYRHSPQYLQPQTTTELSPTPKPGGTFDEAVGSHGDWHPLRRMLAMNRMSDKVATQTTADTASRRHSLPSGLYSNHASSQVSTSPHREPPTTATRSVSETAIEHNKDAVATSDDSVLPPTPPSSAPSPHSEPPVAAGPPHSPAPAAGPHTLKARILEWCRGDEQTDKNMSSSPVIVKQEPKSPPPCDETASQSEHEKTGQSEEEKTNQSDEEKINQSDREEVNQSDCGAVAVPEPLSRSAPSTPVSVANDDGDVAMTTGKRKRHASFSTSEDALAEAEAEMLCKRLKMQVANDNNSAAMATVVTVKQEPCEDPAGGGGGGGMADPCRECMGRIRAKVDWVLSRGLLHTDDAKLISIVRDLLEMLETVSQLTSEENQQLWLEKAHEFEGTLDILKVMRYLPSQHRHRWTDMKNQWCLRAAALCNRANVDSSKAQTENVSCC